MMEVTRHPTPRQRDVVREQIRIVGLELRSAALVVAIVLGIVTVWVVTDIVRGTAATWFDSDEWFPISVISFLVPFAIWRRDRRFAPAFLWTLPVDRRRLALAKVFAGWVWLMTALACLVVWELALAVLSRVTDPQIIPLIAFLGATAAYLFGSALVLGLRHPLRWLLGVGGVIFLVAFLKEALHDLDTFLSSIGLFAAIENAASAWRTLPEVAQWTLTIVIWLGGGLAALWAAVSRHRENR